METFFQIAILVMSVVVHEVSHGYAAYFQGDPTAKYAGRLSPNPIVHLDFFGSLIVPFITSLAGVTFGWAKPVPFNPYNLRSKKWGEFIVASAGPLSNLVVAFLGSIFIRLNNFESIGASSLSYVLSIVVLINISLAVFNLVPIPPLDGSKILSGILPYRMRGFLEKIESNSFILILIFVFIVWDFIAPVIPFLFKLMTGMNF